MTKGRGTRSHIRAIAEKKEPVAKLLASFQDMSLDDINSYPGVAGWIKKVLSKEKREAIIRPPGALTPEEIAERMNNYKP